MKQAVFSLSVALFLFGWGNASHASICITSFKQAALKAAADPQCRSAAQELLKSYTEQVRICKEHRKALKVCREAKQDETKSCQRDKKAAKKDCRKLKGKAERDCKKEAREAKRDCTRDARKQKQACKNEAKDSAAFAVCKDARKLTGKAAGKFGKCAAKHFLPAAIKCAAALAVGAG
jgi:hypothetical protein